MGAMAARRLRAENACQKFRERFVLVERPILASPKVIYGFFPGRADGRLVFFLVWRFLASMGSFQNLDVFKT